MAWFPDADDSVRGSSPGSYKGGPFKIVIHTTEGGSAEGAFSAYRNNNTWPHFTVDQYCIYQHIDTSTSASAVLNESGGVETNRLSAIQIEMVAYAGSPKNQDMLANTAAVCAWLEEQHGIAHEWPNGRPKGSGADHNRSSSNWSNKSGYYGHSQVPENHHWDPGNLSDEEFSILMGGVMQPIRVYINDVEQTDYVKGGLHDANSWLDASDWCKYSVTPVPEFDNAAKDETYAGALHLWTHKTICQVVGEDGVVCTNPSLGLVDIPFPGVPGAIIRQSICAEHQEKILLPKSAAPPEPEKPKRRKKAS